VEETSVRFRRSRNVNDGSRAAARAQSSGSAPAPSKSAWGTSTRSHAELSSTRQLRPSLFSARAFSFVLERVAGYDYRMDNPVTEVPLRKRSTPYTFNVVISHQGRTLQVYSGASANLAGTAYWQAISTLKFVQLNGKVELLVMLSRKAYGSFTTELGTKNLHVPAGECVKWMSGSWSGDHLYEKMLATIPGMPGPYTP
jgi:hypothetical protein